MLECKFVDRGEEAEVLLVGRLDSNSSVEVEPALLSLTSRFSKLVLNLDNLNYISSAGLRVFNKICKAMIKEGGTLEVTNVSPHVMEVFELTGFSDVLNIR